MHNKILQLGLTAALSALIGADTANAQSARPFRLCVVDENMLLARSQIAARMAERFQQIRNQAQQKFQADNNKLEADARALASMRGSLSAIQAKTREEEIARRRAELRERGEEINRNLAALDAELTKNVLQLASPAARAAAAERNCSAVVARSTLLDLGDPSLDITPAVLARMAEGRNR